MKICFVGAFPETKKDVKGGVANVIKNLAYALLERGHEIHIITSGKENKRVTAWEEFDVHMVKIPEYIPRTISNLTNIRQLIHNKLQQINPDICHFHGSAIYALQYKQPYVLTLHGIPELDARYSSGKGVFIKTFVNASIEKYCRKKVPELIIISPYLSAFLGNQLRGRMRVIENPVASIFFDVKRDPSMSFFYGGMINQRKNVLGLIKAFQLVHSKENETKLRIAGPVRDKTYMIQCQQYIEENNLEDSITFLGGLTDREILNELKTSVCMVLPSFQETAPLIIGEAMAIGTPVIASNICGMPFMVKDNETGFLIEANNHPMIADKMLTILNQRDLANSMGALGKETAKARFHIDAVVDKTLQTYNEILKQ